MDTGRSGQRENAANSVFLSENLGALGPAVRELVGEAARLWRETPADLWEPPRRFLRREKKAVEKDLGALVEAVSSEQKKLGAGATLDDPAEIERIVAGLRPFIRSLLARLDLGIEAVYDARFVDATRDFLRAARDFDPDLAMPAVYQALRNVWIMNTLQFYLGAAIEHTDATFGYSMIYPYLDNVLDDPGLSESQKLESVGRLRSWLEGEAATAASPTEEKLRALVGRIERRFPRDRFPAVFRSLLAIHNAQIRSLRQQRRPGPHGTEEALGADEILDISMEKGGTSVLADGYLVAGDLAPSAQRFCFAFGTVLQLADDLQDLTDDLGRGHMTLFSRAAGDGPLDGAAYKLCRFIEASAARVLDEYAARESALRKVIPKNCILMAMEAVGAQPSFFSRTCRRGFERSFPVRFSYLKKLRRRLGDKFPGGAATIAGLDPLSAAFMAVSSRAFSLD